MLGGGHGLQAHEVSLRKCGKGRKGSQKSGVEKDLLLTPVERQETSRDGLLKTKFPARQ